MPSQEADLRRILREALSELRLTQQDFAERAGISQAAISKILDGRTSGKRVHAQILEAIQKSRVSEAPFNATTFDAQLRNLLGRAVEAGLVLDGQVMTEIVRGFYAVPDQSGGAIEAGNDSRSEDEETSMDDPFAVSSEELHDCMISYNSCDRSLAHAVYTYLTTRDIPESKNRLKIWIDSKNLLPGSQFENKIPTVFSQVQLAIVLVGPGGESEWVAKETKYAQANQKTIIPVLIGQGRIENKDLARLTPVLLNDEEDADGLNRLFWAVLRWCRKKGVA